MTISASVHPSGPGSHSYLHKIEYINEADMRWSRQYMSDTNTAYDAGGGNAGCIIYIATKRGKKEALPDARHVVSRGLVGNLVDDILNGGDPNPWLAEVVKHGTDGAVGDKPKKATKRKTPKRKGGAK